MKKLSLFFAMALFSATALFAQSTTISISSGYNTYSVGCFASANSLVDLKTNVATAINTYNLYAFGKF